MSIVNCIVEAYINVNYSCMDSIRNGEYNSVKETDLAAIHAVYTSPL